jgi:hypothetical protein
LLSILPGIIHWYKERKRPVPIPAVSRGTPGAVPEPAPDAVRDA